MMKEHRKGVSSFVDLNLFHHLSKYKHKNVSQRLLKPIGRKHITAIILSFKAVLTHFCSGRRENGSFCSRHTSMLIFFFMFLNHPAEL